jgi:hypothetical protein
MKKKIAMLIAAVALTGARQRLVFTHATRTPTQRHQRAT